MKLPSIVISSIIAIWMANNGYGVWSLVWMYLLQNFFWALFHWLFGDWRPKTHFQKKIFKKHFGYGYRMTLVELMNNISANIYQIVIGKFYNPTLVGYYTQSLTLRQVPVSNIYGAAIKVLFPAFAKIQDNREVLKVNFFRVQEILMYALYPILVFLTINAEDILVILFSEKWKDAAIYLQVLSLAGMFNVLKNWNLAILKILNYARLILRIEVLLKFVLFFLIGISLISKDIKWLLISIPTFARLEYVIYNYILSRSLNFKVTKGFYEILKIIAYLSMSVLISLLIDYMAFKSGLFISFSIKLLLYFFIYLILLLMFKKKFVYSIFQIIKKK